MLYIFQVDTGQMLCFEMDVAISTVDTLKSKIATTHGIPIDKQVLLVSGGEILVGSTRVGNYAAGTDTNPIFLFNRLNIEGGSTQPPDLTGNCVSFGESIGSGNVHLADVEAIQRQIEHTNNLPMTYSSVQTRAQLAQHVYEMGKEILRKCEVLIQHQHLQHQGWAAVVANLDDIMGLFKTKLGAFVTAYESFCKEFLPEHIDAFVDGLESTLKTLDCVKIPEYYSGGGGGETGNQHKSVVTWLAEHYTSHSSTSINSSSPLHEYLQSTATSTRMTYDNLAYNNFIQALQQETNSVIGTTVLDNMKAIKGLESRLFGLDQLMGGAKKLVNDQHELTQAFHQNVARASEMRDSSILPDLCASHQHQLLVMYRNYNQLDDIRRRIGKAKEELTINLNTRLRWVAFVQKSLSEMGGKINAYHQSLRRLRVNVNVLQQVHDCERVFAAYVDEVKCRGRVTRKLGKLTVSISEWGRICGVENARRAQFIDAHGRHFLSQAFSVLIEDREVAKISVPSLVEYVADSTGDDSDDDDRANCDAEKIELRGKVKELEGVIAGLNSSKNAVEVQLSERNKLLEVERERAKHCCLEAEAAKSDAINERGKVEKLVAQVEDLKRLIDEFRVKEDDNIRARELDIAECNRRIREIEAECNERMVELKRMLQFEHAQDIKTAEDKHKLEVVAMVKRFKLVNECSHQVQKMQRDQSTNTDAPAPASPVTTGRFRQTSESDSNVSRSVFALPPEIVFSDDEEDCEVAGSGRDSIRMELEEEEEFDQGEDQGSSLERAQDAMLLHHEEESEPGTAPVVPVVPAAPVPPAEYVIPEKVGLAAQRLLPRISVSSCRVGGNANLFYWNARYNAFTVFLYTNKNVHFLNTNERRSSSGEEKEEEDEEENGHEEEVEEKRDGGKKDRRKKEEKCVFKKMDKSKLFIANITDKEFCVARRAHNRYKVPQGFHFYRVKCKLIEVFDE